jgi:aminoglycoside phosphotransferase (APT) family kinase protein
MESSLDTPTTPSRATSLQCDGTLERLSHWLTKAGIGHARVIMGELLSGGAIQENWRLHLDDGRSLVLRTDSDARIPTSCTRAQEYARYCLAHRHGVLVPRPLGLCEDLDVTGKPFFILEFVRGVTAGHLLVKPGAVPDRDALAFELGALLGTLHRIPREQVQGVFGAAPVSTPAAAVARLRRQLDQLHDPHVVIELCLRELELRLRNSSEAVFSHGDYRTGNYMVDQGRVIAILDWEFCGWSHPAEDLGWFTAPCWRFGRRDLGAGGIGPIGCFLDGYASRTGRHFDPGELLSWQALAQVKWAIIALHQEQRHACGAQRSLELALSGRLVSGLILEAISLLEL